MPQSKHILLLGGTGRVGQQLITTALSQNYHITAIVRTPNSLPPHPNLTLITGQPTSSTSILEALTAISNTTTTTTPITIISTLGHSSSSTSPSTNHMSASTSAVISALRSLPPDSQIHVQKYIILSAFGAAESFASMHWLLRLLFTYTKLAVGLADHDAVIEMVRRNFSTPNKDEGGESQGKLDVPFVVVRPVMLRFEQRDEDRVDQVVPEVKEYEMEGKTGLSMWLKCDVGSLVGFILGAVQEERWDWSMPVIST